MRSLRARPVRIDERLALIAIEAVQSDGNRSDDGCRFYARVEPVALVICGEEPVRALDIDGNAVDLNDLRRDVPALGAMLGAFDQLGELAR